jgi:hypothetical protein
MADGAHVARGVAREDLEDLRRARVPGEPGRGRVGGRLVPVVHGRGEGTDGLGAPGHRFRVHGPHRPVASAYIGRLRRFEVVEGPEKRKPAIRFGRRLGDQVGGVHHEHRVELEPHRWTRLDVPDSRKEKRRETLAVCEAFPNAGRDLFQEPRARRVLEQAHQRLDR